MSNQTRWLQQVVGALVCAGLPVLVMAQETGTNDFRISFMGPDGTTNYGAANPAAAYNSTNTEYLVVWTGDDDSGSLANGEFEVWGQRVDADGTLLGSQFRISTMGTDGTTTSGAFNVEIAYAAGPNEYFVVWGGDDDTGALVDGEFEIYGQRITAATGALTGSRVRISAMGPDGDANYDGNAASIAWNATDGEYLVVWQGDDNTAPLVDDEVEIFGQRVSAAGALLGPRQRLSFMGPNGSTAYRGQDPHVAWSSGQNEFLVAWFSDDNTGSVVDGENEIYGQRYTSAGLQGSRIRISTMGTDGDTLFGGFNPRIAYNPSTGEFLVVWVGDDDSMADGANEAFGQRVAESTGALMGIRIRVSDMGTLDTNVDLDAAFPHVAWDSDTNLFFVAWNGDDDTAPLVNNELEMFGQSLTAWGAAIGVNDVRLSDMGSTDGTTTFNASFSNVVAGAGEFLVVWQGDDELAGLVDNESEIYGQRYASPVVLFAEGFESGDVSQWSSSTP